MSVIILGIESSCDETSAAIIKDRVLVSNVIASQDVHFKYGGVVPELASRAHQQNIIPVVDRAIKEANINKNDINAVAFTNGPGLLGSLLVGASFSKGFSMAQKIPLIEVNHLQGHILVHFLKKSAEDTNEPKFPFLCLLVSGGHTQIVIVKDFLDMEIIGQTIDDAAGEAFDKCAKIMGLPYPGGPVIDRNAQQGNIHAFKFNKPHIQGLDYSFSGLKTSFLYFLRDNLHTNPDFINQNLHDLCASIQHTIVEILLDKLIKASKQTGIKDIAIGGGVAANSYLKKVLQETAHKQKWNVFIPELKLTTDNAAMIALSGYYKYLKNDFASLKVAARARYNINE